MNTLCRFPLAYLLAYSLTRLLEVASREHPPRGPPQIFCWASQVQFLSFRTCSFVNSHARLCCSLAYLLAYSPTSCFTLWLLALLSSGSDQHQLCRPLLPYSLIRNVGHSLTYLLTCLFAYLFTCLLLCLLIYLVAYLLRWGSAPPGSLPKSSVELLKHTFYRSVLAYYLLIRWCACTLMLFTRLLTVLFAYLLIQFIAYLLC